MSENWVGFNTADDRYPDFDKPLYLHTHTHTHLHTVRDDTQCQNNKIAQITRSKFRNNLTGENGHLKLYHSNKKSKYKWKKLANL